MLSSLADPPRLCKIHGAGISCHRNHSETQRCTPSTVYSAHIWWVRKSGKVQQGQQLCDIGNQMGAPTGWGLESARASFPNLSEVCSDLEARLLWDCWPGT